ncbi:hypothetical protein [Nitrosopumilus ureiphilus]|uniref:CbiN domain-containing protein n=1 Tax=Nitrosopumilus ureiphilus TaxID=1470067 RepID=A0A7D5M5T7_9ARCH|nr:hypothetical protein [Nitrosopumilus ureiphilus]QLH07173.1 hypothetical protein C5F50_08855 [Nitrosopumilus ureiphilus]
MKTRLLIIVGLGVLSLISFIPHNAHACSCNGYPDYLRTLLESRSAFQGTVTKIIQADNYEEIYFDITFPQKGISSGKYVIEQSKRSSCAVNYNVGETYQVFTYNEVGALGTTNMCDTKQITGFSEYSHEDENGQIEHYREDYNILTQYNLGTIIIPISIAIIIPSFVVWRKRK